jgi:hypothetical protein
VREKEKRLRGLSKRISLALGLLVASVVYGAGNSMSDDIAQSLRGAHYAGLLENAKNCTDFIEVQTQPSVEKLPDDCEMFEDEFPRQRKERTFNGSWVYALPDSDDFFQEQQEDIARQQDRVEAGIEWAFYSCVPASLIAVYGIARWSRLGQG